MKKIWFILCLFVFCSFCKSQNQTSELQIAQPELQIVQTVSNRFILRSLPVTFEIVVRNKGAGTGTAINLIDTIPNELDYLSSEPAGIFQTAKKEEKELALVQWKIGNLAPQKEITFNMNQDNNFILLLLIFWKCPKA